MAKLDVWQVDELDAFKVWLANDPLAEDVVPGSGGLRKKFEDAQDA